MIDWTRIAQLRRDIGEEDFDEVIDIFVDEVEGIIDRLRDAASPEQIADDLHSLKGSASNLGFTAVTQVCSAGAVRALCPDQGGFDPTELLQTYEVSKACFLDGIAAQLI
ncbi:MAG: Hpt domain-containing protein [Proteobacteria bacterium]|nr:Hpt domain-containing protein [Pseudomonadota bacterium]